MMKKLIFCLLLFILLNSAIFAYYTVDYVAIDNLIVDTDFSNVIKKLEQVKTEDLSKTDKEIVNRKLSDYYKYNNEYDKSKAALKEAKSYSDKNNLKKSEYYKAKLIDIDAFSMFKQGVSDYDKALSITKDGLTLFRLSHYLGFLRADKNYIIFINKLLKDYNYSDLAKQDQFSSWTTVVEVSNLDPELSISLADQHLKLYSKNDASYDYVYSTRLYCLSKSDPNKVLKTIESDLSNLDSSDKKGFELTSLLMGDKIKILVDQKRFSEAYKALDDLKNLYIKNNKDVNTIFIDESYISSWEKADKEDKEFSKLLPPK